MSSNVYSNTIFHTSYITLRCLVPVLGMHGVEIIQQSHFELLAFKRPHPYQCLYQNPEIPRLPSNIHTYIVNRMLDDWQGLQKWQNEDEFSCHL